MLHYTRCDIYDTYVHCHREVANFLHFMLYFSTFTASGLGMHDVSRVKYHECIVCVCCACVCLCERAI